MEFNKSPNREGSRVMMSVVIFLLMLATLSDSAPLKAESQKEEESAGNTAQEFHTGLHYDAYLREVVQVLEQDEEFRKKLEDSPIDHIRSGAIAKELDFMDHGIRSRLDELKRSEIQRLRGLAMQYHETVNNIPKNPLSQDFADHINHANPAKFEVKDLEKLIKKATTDIEKLDKEREVEFKQYEMQKEHERRESMKNMTEEERKKAEQEHEQLVKKHQDHPKVHHPGSKAQLQEVWEETDHMDPESFNPKTFFKMHDINQDGFLDPEELESLFVKELDKVYDPKNTEDDMEERKEDMARMRQHVVKEVDANQDGLVSWEEFEAETKKGDFNQDEGWETVDEQRQFTEEELAAYEAQLREQEEYMRRQGYGQYGEGRGYTVPPPGYRQYEQEQHQQQQLLHHQQQQLLQQQQQHDPRRFRDQIQEMDQQYMQQIDPNYRPPPPPRHQQRQQYQQQQQQHHVPQAPQYQQQHVQAPQYQQQQHGQGPQYQQQQAHLQQQQQQQQHQAQYQQQHQQAQVNQHQAQQRQALDQQQQQQIQEQQRLLQQQQQALHHAQQGQAANPEQGKVPPQQQGKASPQQGQEVQQQATGVPQQGRGQPQALSGEQQQAHAQAQLQNKQ